MFEQPALTDEEIAFIFDHKLIATKHNENEGYAFPGGEAGKAEPTQAKSTMEFNTKRTGIMIVEGAGAAGGKDEFEDFGGGSNLPFGNLNRPDHDFHEQDNKEELIKQRDRMAAMMTKVAAKPEGSRADVLDENDVHNI